MHCSKFTLPDLDLNVEAATCWRARWQTNCSKLQEDLRKAEEAVREDVRIDF